MKLLEISSLGDLPVWVQAFGYLAAVFLIPAGKAILNYFQESTVKVIEDKKESLKICNERKELLKKENEVLRSEISVRDEKVAQIQLEFSVMEGKVAMLKQFLTRDGYENFEI